jgi:RHS repeat-associated protein
VYYYHQDQLGSTRAMSDSTGAVQTTYTYDAYGNIVVSTGSLTNPFRFAGQLLDVESGLYYLRARYYDTISGQMISADPLRQQTRQAYSYASNNPVDLSDPSGLCDINPFSGSSCLSAGASWVYQNASTISAVTGTAAAILAPIPGADLLAVPLAGVSLVTGSWRRARTSTTATTELPCRVRIACRRVVCACPRGDGTRYEDGQRGCDVH